LSISGPNAGKSRLCWQSPQGLVNEISTSLI
jgi:hypothetical protein